MSILRLADVPEVRGDTDAVPDVVSVRPVARRAGSRVRTPSDPHPVAKAQCGHEARERRRRLTRIRDLEAPHPASAGSPGGRLGNVVPMTRPDTLKRRGCGG